jgi:hypothetical protein
MTEDDKTKIKNELPHYEKASSIYKQIFSLHEYVTKVSEIYLIVTGAAWTAALSKDLEPVIDLS